MADYSRVGTKTVKLQQFNSYLAIFGDVGAEKATLSSMHQCQCKVKTNPKKLQSWIGVAQTG